MIPTFPWSTGTRKPSSGDLPYGRSAKLLDEVLASLSGKPGYNRVLKLRVPFGGGKSHTWRRCFMPREAKALDGIGGEIRPPGNVAVAVLTAKFEP